jgi:flagellum-specific peptidoglycan hydrolase FlgJ
MKTKATAVYTSFCLLFTPLNVVTTANDTQKQFDADLCYNSAVTQSAIAVPTVTPASITTKAAVKKKVKKVKVKYTKDTVYTITTVNVRKSPSKKKKAVKVISAATKVKRVGVRSDGWAIVKNEGKTRFIYNKYLSKSKPKVITKSDTTLSGQRKSRADYIAKVCIQNYKTYKVLPSVCVAQALVESGLGESCKANNYWGISSNGYGGFSSLEAGVLRYLQVINNGYYKGAVGTKSYTTAAYAIQNGGYCCPSTGYAAKIISMVKMYRLTDYDKYI